MTKTIYDFGANNGDDLPYYLLKADRVVAIEANPVLCQIICRRFESEILSGRLVVENCVVTAKEELPEITFYIHKEYHVLSQLPQPESHLLPQFKKVHLPSKSVLDIIDAHGKPYYIKIDLERYDSQLLRALFNNDIFPPFISAESHHIDVFCLLVSCSRYNAFKLLDGPTVSQVYSERLISSEQGDVEYSFPYHSAGPFGNDIDGKWLDASSLFQLLAEKGLGWKDIHATSQENPIPSGPPVEVAPISWTVNQES